jgi:zeaxanthin glucosyltransferase
MKLGFICVNVPGHLNPMTALARHLQARNHDVVFLYSSCAAGLPFVPGPEKDHVNESILKVSRMQGDDVLELSVRLVLAQTETILRSLPATVAATGVDALVLDAVQWYGIGGDAVGHAVYTRVKRPVL